MKKIFTILVLALSILESCSTSKNVETKLLEEKIIDIAYGAFPSSRMDLFLPARRNNQTPFIIFTHGGGWQAGDKKDLSDLQNYVLTHGIASASINYRYVDDKSIHFIQLLADVDSAMSYCITHSNEWKTRDSKYTLSGFSAGAHLSLLSGLHYII